MSTMRDGMDNLVGMVRRLIGDTDRSTYKDDEIQDALDNHRAIVNYGELDAIPTTVQGGSVTYLTFKAAPGMWEGTAGLTFVDANWGTITPRTEDWRSGQWTFAGSATPPFGPARPVRVSGSHYDIYGAAVELMDSWPVSTSPDDIDVTEGIFTYKYSQRASAREKLAESYRSRMWPSSACVVRSDVV